MSNENPGQRLFDLKEVVGHLPSMKAILYHASSTAGWVSGLLGWLSLALAAFWVYRMKGIRWFAFSVVAMLQIILMGAFFVSGMAVSGDWL